MGFVGSSGHRAACSAHFVRGSDTRAGYSSRPRPSSINRTAHAVRGADGTTSAQGTHESILQREQWYPRPPAEIFAFFADAMNLETITPAFLHFRVVGTSTPTLGEGTRIDYRLRLHGLPLRWQSRIEEWHPLERFVDRQTRGPYSLWHHTHEFEAREGGTLVRDRVRYRLPFGALGAFVAGALVRRDLEAIFDFRQARLQQLFAADSAEVHP